MQKNLPLPLCHSAILTEVRSPILYRRYRAAVKCGVGRGEHCSVIAYYSMRKIAERCADIKTIANIIGADYIVTGDIQSNNDRMRVYVQLIDTFNSQPPGVKCTSEN